MILRKCRANYEELTSLINKFFSVAPFAGAWIETDLRHVREPVLHVAPFAGAWIETSKSFSRRISVKVAPFAGAWIETQTQGLLTVMCRSLRGSVD